MHKKALWRKLWRIRLQPPRYLPLYKFEILPRKKSVLMCVKFYRKPRNSKSSWNQSESLSMSSVAFFFTPTPTMISTFTTIDAKCSSMIAFTTSKSYLPCHLRHLKCCLQGNLTISSAQVRNDIETQSWWIFFSFTLIQVWHTSDSEANISDPTFSHLEAHFRRIEKPENQSIPTNQREGSQILLLKPLNERSSNQ